MATSPPIRRKSGTRRKPSLALLVDDSVDSREMYGKMLLIAGYRVLEAGNGEEALALAFAQRPDVIIMDLFMPRMDGWEAIRRLKQDPRTKTVPIVALTAIGWNARAIQVDCDAYLIKPCMPADLVGVLDSLVEKARTA